MRRLVTLAMAGLLLFSACTSSSSGGVSGTVAPPVLGSAAASAAASGASPVSTGSPAISASADPSRTPAPSEAASPSAGDENWYLLAPPGDGFTARFPKQPKLTSSATPTKVGDAPTFEWTYQESTHLIYVVGLVKYPAGSLAGVAPSTIFDLGVQGMVKAGDNATIDSQTDITLGDNPGRAFVAIDGEQTMKGRIYLVADRMYMVFVVYDSSADTSALDLFFADFSL